MILYFDIHHYTYYDNYSPNQPNIPVKFTSTGVLDVPTRLRGLPPSSHTTARNENVQTVAECDKV